MNKIIVVDDDEFVQHIVKVIFENFDIQVVIFPNGESLLNSEFEVPDIFILDKQLPGISGVDLCRNLKTRDCTKHIPVIMVSATNDIKAVSKLAGADAALEKPFSIKTLKEVVFSMIGLSNQWSEAKDLP